MFAKHFENDNIFVKYTIDLPEHWTCHDNSLTGLTQTCHAVSENGLMHFNHTFDVVLQYDIQNLNDKNGKCIFFMFDIPLFMSYC